MSNQGEKCRGEIEECLGNQRFKVKLPSGYVMHCYLSGKMNMHKIKVMVGDEVDILKPEYGEIGRIVKRI